MGAKALINAHPKNVLGSKGARRCRVCGTSSIYLLVLFSVLFTHFLFCLSRCTANQGAIIRKYHLHMCRQCFRERAEDIGFVKVRTNLIIFPFIFQDTNRSFPFLILHLQYN